MVAKDKKVLKVGIVANVDNLDPQKAQDYDSLMVLRQFLETPFGIKAGTTESEPALFTGDLRREQGSGPPVYRARLRDGIRLSDGSPLSASDVATSLAQVALVNAQATVDVDGADIVFTLKRPNARFDLVLSHPQSFIYRMQDGVPLGTGPFQLSPDSEPSRVRLVRNPHYRDEVALDEIVFTVYSLAGDQATKLLAAIEHGEVDFTNALTRDDVNRVSGMRKSLLPGVSTAILYFNTESPNLSDPRLRQALARSVDRIEVAKITYQNALAFAASGLLPRSLGAADDDLSYDPAEAESLLAAIDQPVPPQLSVLMPWGPRLYLPRPKRVFETLAGQLKQIGTELVPYFPANSVEYSNRVIAGTEDMTLIGWVADTMDPADFLDANLASDRVPTSENIAVSTNNGRLRNLEMDQALEKFRADRASGSLDEVMRLLSDQAPLVPLAYGPATAVYSYQVQGFTPTALSIFPLSDLDLAT